MPFTGVYTRRKDGNIQSMNKHNYIYKIIGKTIISGFLLCFFLLGFVFSIEQAEWEKDGTDLMERVELCEFWYSEKDYEQLYGILSRNKNDEPEFDIYHEMMDGYWDYLYFRAWSKAGDSSIVTGSQEKAEYYEKKVMENANNCQNSRNQYFLDKLAEEVEK